LKPLASILFVFTLFILTACEQAQIKAPPGAADKFDDFKRRDKFITEQNYPGIADVKMKPILTEKINKAADDFQTLSKTSHVTDKDYQEKIKIGLDRFADIYNDIDTEDRERICTYFQELMDIVGLKSSGGQLNKFMYGFDPKVK
jgi:DNA-binding transcriptional regulator GbsR (MarR family)